MKFSAVYLAARVFPYVSGNHTTKMCVTPANIRATQKDQRQPKAGEVNPDTIGPSMGPKPVT